ncbi:putative serine/threonine-protein kinase SIS8 [Bienertia sinuspersici]
MFWEMEKGQRNSGCFLFTSSDLEEAHYSLSGGDVDSEFQYVVAVNCMEMGNRKHSGMHDIASSSNDLDALMGQNADRGINNVAGTVGVSSSSHAGGADSSSGMPPSQPIVSHSHQFQGQVIQHVDSKGYQLQGGHDAYPPTHLLHEDSISATSQHRLSTNQQKITEAQPHQGDKKGNLPAEEESGSTVNSGLVKDFSDLPPKSEKRHQEHILTSSSDAVHVPRVSEPINPDSSHPFDYAYPSEHAHSEPNSLNMNHTELPATQRPYLSVNIPREQGELLSRLTKSDDSLNSQFLMSHSQTSAGQQDLVTTSSGKLQNMNVIAESVNLNGSKEVDNEASNSAANKDAREDNPFLERKLEMSCPKDNHKRHLVDGGEVGHVHTDASKPSNSEQHDRASTPAEFKWADEARQNSTGNAAESILIDINDRFPRDLLSDIFSKAILSEESSSFNQLPHDGAGLSMNIENHEPKHWSFFQNLAKDDFRKDVSLMDQDHPIYSSGLTKVDGEVSGVYQFTPLSTDVNPSGHVDSHMFGEYNQRELPDTVLDERVVVSSSDYNPSLQAKYSEVQFDGVGAPYSDYEEVKQEAKHVGLPPLDPSIVNFDISTLQLIKNDDLEELRELGSGTFGTVYHGKWRGTDVAIKRIKKSCFTGRSSEQERLTVEFWHEAEILSKLHHPNVVAFYGVVQDGPGGTLATVTEFMVDGSLRHVLLKKDRHLDRRKRLLIAMDAAFGMEYLHLKNIVHFDLKCDNLLVNLKDSSRPICKVGDFGLSKIKRNTLVSGGVRGTLPWMAPELLNGSSSKVSEKVDVFSFGIVLWEILTGESLMQHALWCHNRSTALFLLWGIVNNTLRPPIPSYCDSEWRILMEQCWAPNPAARPSFTEIAGRLRTMAAACQTKAQGPKASH